MSSVEKKSPAARAVLPPSHVTFLGSFPGELPSSDLPEIAFAGRSNVGKSSAINALLGRKSAARVSRSPGRTQAVNLFDVDGVYLLADLPGYGFAKVPIEVQHQWKGMVEHYFATRAGLRRVVCLVDSRLPPQKLDLDLIAGLRAAEIEHYVVATKVDKLPKSKRKSMLQKLASGLATPSLHALSTLNGEGVEALRLAIRGWVR